MKFVKIAIENYKGLRKVEFPLSQFVCFIGENNAGKSSVLQAISLFLSGSSLPKSHYFDSTKNICIEITLNEISDEDINRLAEEHRERINSIIIDGKLTLVRVWGLDGKSSLKYKKLVPRDQRFSEPQIALLLKGKKAGNAMVQEITLAYPELNGIATNQMNQGEIKQIINDLADRLPDDQKEISDINLPTGIPESVSALLPDPIYIQAVKDLKDEVKTTESTPFGKVLGILLKVIEPLLAEEKTLFDKLNSKLNRTKAEDGTELDNRLEPVKSIEKTVEKYINESFNSVKLKIKIPPPELKNVLSSALLYADDGIEGLLDTKGDGLRRAVVFAILRSYVEFSKSGIVAQGQEAISDNNRYLLLFEEPELFLHPRAQQILFEALGIFSKNHPVIVTTHSPLFLGPESTNTFIKIQKVKDQQVSEIPFAKVHPIDLSDTNARDQFQLICFENNNIAFFADEVIFVEGDSDYIVLPHIAKLLNSNWDHSKYPIRYARIGGKGNIKRYADFFKRFGIRIYVVTDIDFLLGKEFGQISPTNEIKAIRDELFKLIDADVITDGAETTLKNKDLKRAQEDNGLKSLWNKIKRLQMEFNAGKIKWEVVQSSIDEFFSWEKYWARKEILKTTTNKNILKLKLLLLHKLRSIGVFVLEKGVIEDYYPEDIPHDSKPAMAQSFCRKITTKEQALALSNTGHLNINNTEVTELEAIFNAIFKQ